MNCERSRELTVSLRIVAAVFMLWLSSAARAEDFNFTSIDFPGATLTQAQGINSEGDISGVYSFVARVETSFNNHAFVLSKGTFTSFDPPGSTTTFGWKINARGQIGGCWTDANGTVHGFL